MLPGGKKKGGGEGTAMQRSLAVIVTLKDFYQSEGAKSLVANSMEIIGREELQTVSIENPFREFSSKRRPEKWSGG